MFTERQIKEIFKNLSHLGIKDSQLKDVNIVEGEEEFILVRNNENQRINLENFTDYLSAVVVPVENEEEELFPEEPEEPIEPDEPVEPEIPEEKTYYNITVEANPQDAYITINGQPTNTIKLIKNTRVSVVITKDGYEPITESFILTEDKKLSYELIAITYNFKLLPYYFNTPMPNNSNLEIYINNVKYSPSGGNYFVDADFPKNTVINYSVSFGSPYYTKEEGSFVIVEDTIKEIHIYSNDVFTLTKADYFKIDRITNEAQQIKLTWYYGVKPDSNIDDSVDINSPYTIDVTNKVTMNNSNNENWLSWDKETGLLTVEQNTTGKDRSLFVTFNYESKGMSSGINIVQKG